jgi:hypothetical protein
MGVFAFGQFGRNLANRSNQFAATVNHRFEFQKHGQLFIRMHDETLSIAAGRVNNLDRCVLPVSI